MDYYKDINIKVLIQNSLSHKNLKRILPPPPSFHHSLIRPINPSEGTYLSINIGKRYINALKGSSHESLSV